MKEVQKTRMPTVGIVWVVLGVVLLMLCLSGYIMENMEQLLIMILGAVAVVTALVAAFAWDVLEPFRKGVRGAMTILPSLLGAIGLLLPLYVLIVRPEDGVLLMSRDATFGFNLTASLGFMLFAAQVLEVFFLPTLAAAASFGNRFDILHFRVHACVNAVLLAFNVFISSTSFIGLPKWNTTDVVSPTWYIPNIFVPDGASELAMTQVVVLAVALLLAGLSFLPLSRKQASEN